MISMSIRYRKKILFFLIFCPVFLWYFSVFAEKKTIVIGGSAGWSGLSVKNGITAGKGRFGYDCLELAAASEPLTADTDLLLDFEGDTIKDSAGNYTITNNSLILEKDIGFGKHSALCRGNGKGLSLSGKNGSFFGTGNSSGSFLIEFWLKPSISENGEIIFSWRSSRNVNDYPVYQMITSSFFNNRVEWKFTNIFDGYTADNGEITLVSYRTIIPGKWAHHEISFDEESGLLEYRINGSLEALRYVTSSGKTGGSIYAAVLGVPADIHICPSFTGNIDEFRIVKTPVCENSVPSDGDPEPDGTMGIHYLMYKKEGGRFETQPLPVPGGSELDSIDAVADIPPQTAVDLYVRGGDNFYNWTDSYPAWVPVENGEAVTGVTGKYFQVAGNIFPDGNGDASPSITEIKINYTEQPLPLPPFSVTAVPGDGSVTISWTYSVDDLSGGYYVYYGEHPGEYLGRAAAEGASPVNAGNTNSVTLTGLKNGTIYYFAVSSCSRFDSQIRGELSEEVYARPKQN
jgi:hypothetical protein